MIQIKGTVFFELFIHNDSQSRKKHWRHSLGASITSWFLAMKCEEGKRATRAKLDTLFANQALDFTVVLGGSQCGF